ncbi:MAG: mechanosensitive ion channel family protein [Planctomycetota bacterium]|nr:mechanosensitive ion channel family protein [Planctomycetota bacterium]MDP6990801.1 mechanosensitive ion channel family protein [Planctomycetota bacterium]
MLQPTRTPDPRPRFRGLPELGSALLAAAALAGGLLPGQEEEPAAAAPAAVEHASPREAMGAFLRGVGSGNPIADWDLARTALETLPDGSPPDKGKVARLKWALDRAELVDLEEFPAAGDPELFTGREWTWAPYSHNPRVQRAGIEVRFVEEGTHWRIAASIFERVDDWWQAVQEEPIVGEVLEGLAPLDRLHWKIREVLPQTLLKRSFLIENWQWLALLVLVVGGVVLDRLVCAVIKRVAARVASDERLSLDRSVFGNFERPFGIFVTALVLKSGLPLVGVDPQFDTILTVAAGFVLAVSGAWASFRLVDVVCAFLADRARLSVNRFDDMLVPLLRRTLKILLSILFLVYLASFLSEDLMGIIAGLSIGTLAVGFAAKDSIENLFGTFTVLLDKPFQLGDWITVGDIDGTVEAVGFRSTRVRTFYNSVISVPNSRFISAHVDNWGRRRYRRIKSTLGLTYDTPPEKIEAFCEGVRELIRTHPYTRKDSYHVYLNSFADSSLGIMLYCFVETPDWSTELRERHRLFNDILRVAEDLKVEFAFPTQTLHMAQPGDLEHPDRPADAAAGVEAGRAAGRAVAERGLAPFGGEKPPPVVID